MSDEYDRLREKVAAVFARYGAERAERVESLPNSEIRQTLTAALSSTYGQDRANQIAFHLTDPISDAAFLVALHLCPEQFTPEDIATGVLLLLLHAPNHFAAAATIALHPIQDVFGVGVPEGTGDED